MMKDSSWQAAVVEAHKHCTSNLDRIEPDELCGCFYCLEVFRGREITNSIRDKNGPTALCPRCIVDSVIMESSGYPITREFLSAMHDRWFG